MTDRGIPSVNEFTFSTEAVARRCSVKKVFLKYFAEFTGKHLCQWPEACNFIKKEALAKVVSCKFFKNSF